MNKQIRNHSFTIIDDILIADFDFRNSDAELLQRQQTIAKAVYQSHIQRVVLDLSSTLVVDSSQLNLVDHTIKILRLLGAETILAGISPALASTIAELKSVLLSQHCVLNVEQAMAMLKGSDDRQSESSPDGEELVNPEMFADAEADEETSSSEHEI